MHVHHTFNIPYFKYDPVKVQYCLWLVWWYLRLPIKVQYCLWLVWWILRLPIKVQYCLWLVWLFLRLPIKVQYCLWLVWWILRLPLVEKPLLQMLQMKGFSPVCVLMWVVNAKLLWQFLWQTWHWYCRNVPRYLPEMKRKWNIEEPFKICYKTISSKYRYSAL